jgi:iron complex transport system ATP-binding protein
MSAAAGFSVQALSVRYGEQTVVHDVSFAVAPGEVVALAGPNGSGKSTLLRAATGLLSPSAGAVLLPDGRRVADLGARDRARQLAWMPQEEPEGDNVPLAEYVAYGRYAHGSVWERPSSADQAAVTAALEETDLADKPERGVRQLSGGERQRARLARALAQETAVLLLDEPTAHLDIGHQLDVLGRVRRIARQSPKAVVVALHDLNLAARFSDRIVVLSHGRRVADGVPSEVLSAELLERVWGIVAEVRRDRVTGLPYLLPRLAARAPSPPASASPGPRVHVVAGGGSGADLLRRLVDEGYDVTAGVLPLFDTDAVAAQELGVPTAVELPFAPIGAEALGRLRELLAGAEAIVVAPFPVGPTNAANLEAIRSFAGTVPVVLVDQPAGLRWDYADGRGARARDAVAAAGAVAVPDVTAAVAWLGTHLARAPGSPPTPVERHDRDRRRA